jgi:hypothetical protein
MSSGFCVFYGRRVVSGARLVDVFLWVLETAYAERVS